MTINNGYVISDKTIKGDETYTPYYAVEPILKYIPKDKVVWCPFDKEWSAYVKLIEENNKVIYSHLDDGYDFFTYEPKEYDIIISNPHFSKKDKIIKRLYELEKPFAILLPLNTLQGIKRFKYLKNGIQVLSFDKRIGFHDRNTMAVCASSNFFASAYFCKDFLPSDLIIEELIKYNRPLLEGGDNDKI